MRSLTSDIVSDCVGEGKEERRATRGAFNTLITRVLSQYTCNLSHSIPFLESCLLRLLQMSRFSTTKRYRAGRYNTDIPVAKLSEMVSCVDTTVPAE